MSRLKQIAAHCAGFGWQPGHFAKAAVPLFKSERAMIWLLLIALPVCVELAAWAVDASFETYVLKGCASGDSDGG
jgi:hypothetical protein